MKKIKLLWLTCLTVFLLGLTPGGAVWADDGGGDGGGDGGDGGDDGGEGHDDGEHDGDWHHDGDHWVDHNHWYGGWGPWGFGPGFGFGYGGFGFMPPFYPSPYYAYPGVAVRPSAPPVYIQQPDAGQPGSQPQNNYWHYCQASAGYYPQVPECPDGWVQVPPQAQINNQENPM